MTTDASPAACSANLIEGDRGIAGQEPVRQPGGGDLGDDRLHRDRAGRRFCQRGNRPCGGAHAFAGPPGFVPAGASGEDRCREEGG
ncbi:MAG: hypothetical protein R3F11_04800 [Verrucomicrobiales bacterium]